MEEVAAPEGRKLKFVTHVSLFVSAMVECEVTNADGSAVIECRVHDAKSVRSAFTVQGVRISPSQEEVLQHLAGEAALERTLEEYQAQSEKLNAEAMPEFVSPEGGAQA